MNATDTRTAPKCSTCHVREASFDSESQGYFSSCFTCSGHHASAPRCCAKGVHVAPDHTSVKTVPVMGADGELLGYECPECQRRASFTGWTIATARDCARSTVKGEQWLIDVRRKVQAEMIAAQEAKPADAMPYERAHPQTLVYAREFLAELARLGR